MRVLNMLFACCLTLALGIPAIAAEVYRGPYLQQASSDDVVVVWRTDGEIEPVLRYGASPEALDQSVAGDAITLRTSADVDAPEGTPQLFHATEQDLEEADEGKYISTIPGTWQYEASVTGLKPGTTYYYAVYNGDTQIAGGDQDHFFKTYQPEGTAADLRVWVVGDSGTGGNDQAMVHDAMQEFTTKTDRPLDLYLHVGDMAYGDGTDEEFQKNFFAPYQETLRNTVCWPTMGNHEGHTSRGTTGVGPYYDAYVVPVKGEVGGAPSGTEAYYSFDIADVHFVCLDSHDLDRSPDAPMAQWLRADLEQADAKWLVAFWHHPPYTKGSHDSDVEGQLIEMRENFMPTLEAGGVDLVLAGHSHIYERSMLIDGAYATPTTADGVILDDGDGRVGGDGAYTKSEGLNPHEGTVAMVAGHGGAGTSRRGTMPVMREILLEYGSVLLDFQGDTLTGTMVDKHGKRRDVFSMIKRGTVPAREPIVDPWQPKHDLSQISRFRLHFESEEQGATPEGWTIVSGADTGKAGVDSRDLIVTAADTNVVGVYEELTVREFEYEALFELPEDGGTAAGVVFGYTDPQNYWALLVDADNDEMTVVQVKNGDALLLETVEVDVEQDKLLKLEMAGGGRRLEVEFRNEDVIRTLLPEEVPEGSLGFIVEAGSTGSFLRFDIERD
jgi:hypothetical protein